MIRIYYVERIFKALLLLILIILTILFLIPIQELPGQAIFKRWDKVQHTIFFMGLTIIAFFAYPKIPLKLFVYLSLYGAFIEVLQSTTSWRKGEFYDWVADIIGIFIIYIGFKILRKFTVNTF